MAIKDSGKICYDFLLKLKIAYFGLLYRKIYEKMKVSMFNFSGYFTIILTESFKPRSTIAKIFKDCWLLHIANVNLVSLDTATAKVNIFTFFPYSPVYCDRTEPTLWMTFSNNSFHKNGTDIFPNKLSNFYNCPLAIATHNVTPYMILTKYDNGSYYTDGLEGIIFRVLSQRLNFRPVIYCEDKGNENIPEMFKLVRFP